MNNFIKTFIATLALSLSLSAQTALTQTTLSAAVSVTANQIRVASATGITVNSALYVVDFGQVKGELMFVRSVSGTTVDVIRTGGSAVTGHATGAVVIIAPRRNAFFTYNPQGTCNASTMPFTPWVNTTTGEQWLCGTEGVFIPGFGRNQAVLGTTTTVASAAGAITPSGPLFVVSGTAAVTGFNLPVGFSGGGFCALPTGTFTTTTAGNIGLASTAVVGRTLCWTWSQAAGKWYPSY
jgi:hypothetical protein